MYAIITNEKEAMNLEGGNGSGKWCNSNNLKGERNNKDRNVSKWKSLNLQMKDTLFKSGYS